MNYTHAGAAYLRLQFLELLRVPAFVIPTLTFPAMFFALFDLQYAHAYPSMAPNMVLAYVAFAIVGVALSQFGIGVAMDRALPWERYLRTLGTPIWVRFATRVAVAGIFACCAAGLLIAVASMTTSVRFDPGQWLSIGAASFAGAAVFVLFGLAIGYWCSPKAAVPVCNVFYLLLSFAGGLWIPPQFLPNFARAISSFTPTRQFANLLWSAPYELSMQALLALGGFAALFAAVAAAGYRRDVQARFG